MQRRRVSTEKNPAKKMAKNMSVFAFITCLVVIAVIFVFAEHKKEDKSVVTTSSTEVEKISAKDLELAYPGTPAEVLKLFGRINQCMYNTSMKEEEFDQLLKQMRMLYSRQLLEQNPYEEQRINLKAEVDGFISNKKRIVNYTVDKSSSVEYEKIEGQECAYAQLAYFINENGQYSKTFQEYVMIKEDGLWKILAFRKNTAQAKS